MATEIVKVQRPLASSDPDPGWSVYAKTRRHVAVQHVPEEVKRAIGDGLKGYFNADWDDKTLEWTFGDKVPDEAW